MTIKNCTQHGEKSPKEENEIETVGTRTAINRNSLTIGRHIEFLQSGQ